MFKLSEFINCKMELEKSGLKISLFVLSNNCSMESIFKIIPSLLELDSISLFPISSWNKYFLFLIKIIFVRTPIRLDSFNSLLNAIIFWAFVKSVSVNIG